ncbi:hypothetical protein PSY31_22905, partial [Shigella flexneri]|nr:hypothetical protein [Shigella flexneri]
KNIYHQVLPSFYGLAHEDPLIFLREFYAVVFTLPFSGLTKEQLRKRTFPFTLKDKAKAWLMALLGGSLATWKNIFDRFIDEHLSSSKST